jgi:hypothetical protein
MNSLPYLKILEIEFLDKKGNQVYTEKNLTQNSIPNG